jgi:carbon storage regulator CsrA
MLVLTRKLQEKITIAGNITVTVLRVKGQTVRIGIEAPREIRVVRGELPMEAAAEGSQDQPAGSASAEPVQEGATEGTVPAPLQPHARMGNAARLPQRRKFDRYSQPPLQGVVHSAVALAK